MKRRKGRDFTGKTERNKTGRIKIKILKKKINQFLRIFQMLGFSF